MTWDATGCGLRQRVASPTAAAGCADARDGVARGAW